MSINRRPHVSCFVRQGPSQRYLPPAAPVPPELRYLQPWSRHHLRLRASPLQPPDIHKGQRQCYSPAALYPTLPWIGDDCSHSLTSRRPSSQRRLPAVCPPSVRQHELENSSASAACTYSITWEHGARSGLGAAKGLPIETPCPRPSFHLPFPCPMAESFLDKESPQRPPAAPRRLISFCTASLAWCLASS